MATDNVPVPLRQALGDLVRWIDEEHLKGVVIGGVAVALLGRPRITRDVDAMVLLEDKREEDLLTSAQEYGFEPRLSDALEFARRRSVLLFRHQPSGIDVEVILGLMPFEEETIARASAREVLNVRVPLPSPEDLIIMKAVAGRPHDLRDIEGIVESASSLDRQRILRWVQEYADLMEKPEILESVQRQLAK